MAKAQQSRPKMSDSIEYRFVSDAYTPETIPQARLAEYLAVLARLYGESASLHFVGLETGSLAILSRADGDAAEEVSERVESAPYEEGPSDLRKAYSDLKALVEEDKEPARIERGGSVVLDFLTGQRRDESQVYGPFIQRGHLTGQVILLGGKSELVSVRLLVRNKPITCKAKRDVAKQLRDHLWGSPVRVEGSGRWIRTETGAWKLISFLITDFDSVDDEPLSATVARLRSIEGKWKSRPDPIAELDMLRNGESHN